MKGGSITYIALGISGNRNRMALVITGIIRDGKDARNKPKKSNQTYKVYQGNY